MWKTAKFLYAHIMGIQKCFDNTLIDAVFLAFRISNVLHHCKKSSLVKAFPIARKREKVLLDRLLDFLVINFS